MVSPLAENLKVADATPQGATEKALADQSPFAETVPVLRDRPGVLSFRQNLPSKNPGLGGRAWDMVRTVAKDKYSAFRLACYTFADYFTPLSKTLQGLHQRKLEDHFAPDSAKPYQAGEGMPFNVSSPQGYTKKRFLFTETFDPIRTVTTDGTTYTGWYEQQIERNKSIDEAREKGGLTGLLSWFKDRTPIGSDLEINLGHGRAKHSFYMEAAKLLMSRIEGIFFAGLTTLYFASELGDAKRNMAAAVGAEIGKDPGEVGLRDIVRSKNPFIVSERNRLVLETLTSYGADLSFMKNIKVGLLGAAVKTTIMRTKLNRDRAPYDVFRSAVGRIQRRNGQMTDSAREAFVDELSDVVQMLRGEQRLPLIQHDALAQIRPVYDHLVRAIAEGEIDQQGALYFLGCCLDEHHAEQSMYNLHALINHGPEGVAKAQQQKLDLSQPAKEKPAAAKPEVVAPEQTYSEGRNNAIKQIVGRGAASLSPTALLERSGAQAASR